MIIVLMFFPSFTFCDMCLLVMNAGEVYKSPRMLTAEKSEFAISVELHI